MVIDPAEAYAVCARFARTHYENFPVASALLPRAMRPHVAAVYAFARVADDFADEGVRSQAERLLLLDAWRGELHGCVDHGGPARAPGGPGLQSGSSPLLPPDTPHIFAALGSTIRACRLPVSLFDDLLSAFRQDVTVTRYETWDDVLDYCRRSANPVGRLVLGIGGCHGVALERGSDALCTALQLTNFWQDLGRDWRNGRLYVPLEDCRREGADLADLDGATITAPWRETLRGACARSAALYDEARAVCDGVGGRLGLELRLTWLGGRRILSEIEHARFDVLRHRPVLGVRDVPGLLWHAMTWRAR